MSEEENEGCMVEVQECVAFEKEALGKKSFARPRLQPYVGAKGMRV